MLSNVETAMQKNKFNPSAKKPTKRYLPFQNNSHMKQSAFKNIALKGLKGTFTYKM